MNCPLYLFPSLNRISPKPSIRPPRNSPSYLIQSVPRPTNLPFPSQWSSFHCPSQTRLPSESTNCPSPSILPFTQSPKQQLPSLYMYLPLPCLSVSLFQPSYRLPLVQISLVSTFGRYYETKVPVSFLLSLVLFKGLSTLLKLLADPNCETPEFPDKILVSPPFISDMLRVFGKFLRLLGKVCANFENDGLESSFLSSISLSKQQILSGYLFLTMLSLLSSSVQLMLFLEQSQMLIQGLSRHSWMRETANDQTPALDRLDPNSPISLSYSGARNTSSQCSPFFTSITFETVGKSLESMTLGSGMPADSPKQILLNLTLELGIF